MGQISLAFVFNSLVSASSSVTPNFYDRFIWALATDANCENGFELNLDGF